MHGQVIPDPIERGEDACMAWLARAEKDLEPGWWRCDCGRIDPEADFDAPHNPDPYATPICSECQRKWWDKNK